MKLSDQVGGSLIFDVYLVKTEWAQAARLAAMCISSDVLAIDFFYLFNQQVSKYSSVTHIKKKQHNGSIILRGESRYHRNHLGADLLTEPLGSIFSYLSVAPSHSMRTSEGGRGWTVKTL